MNRRDFIASMMAGAVVAAEELYVPKKLISIPSGKTFAKYTHDGTDHTVNFTVSGLKPGDRVYACYADEMEWNERYQTNLPKQIFNVESRGPTVKHDIVYQTDREILVRVKDSGMTPIKTFEQVGTITNTGFDITALRVKDV